MENYYAFISTVKVQQRNQYEKLVINKFNCHGCINTKVSREVISIMHGQNSSSVCVCVRMCVCPLLLVIAAVKEVFP